MSTKPAFLALLTAFALAGCGGTYTVSRTQSVAPVQIQKVAFSPQAGNSEEVTAYIKQALASRGIEAGSSLKSGSVKTPEADAVVRYVDVWRWDLVTYMQSINIDLYNAMTGQLIATGRWEDSLLHSYNRGESVSAELVSRLLSKVETGSQAANTPAASREPARPQASPPTKPAKAADPKLTANARLDYEAWQQVRNYPECFSPELGGVEGAGTATEQYTFECTGGTQVTITCRTSQGCS